MPGGVAAGEAKAAAGAREAQTGTWAFLRVLVTPATLSCVCVETPGLSSGWGGTGMH